MGRRYFCHGAQAHRMVARALQEGPGRKTPYLPRNSRPLRLHELRTDQSAPQTPERVYRPARIIFPLRLSLLSTIFAIDFFAASFHPQPMIPNPKTGKPSFSTLTPPAHSRLWLMIFLVAAGHDLSAQPTNTVADNTPQTN